MAEIPSAAVTAAAEAVMAIIEAADAVIDKFNTDSDAKERFLCQKG